jgi:acetyltransferase-like isoleucine patch superfamily enzyme
MVTSLISPNAIIGSDFHVGHFSRIGDNVVIGNRVQIGDNCVIGEETHGKWQGLPLRIPDDSVIRSHSVLYEGSEFASKLETGHHALIREGTRAGLNLRVGSYVDIEGDCDLGDYLRVHSAAHIAKGSSIGHFVWMFPQSILINDPLPPSHLFAPVTVGDGGVLCTASMALPGTVLGMGAFLTAGSIARGEYPTGAVISGAKGEVVCHVTKLRDLTTGTKHPWMQHFTDAYPESAHERLMKLQAAIVTSFST